MKLTLPRPLSPLFPYRLPLLALCAIAAACTGAVNAPVDVTAAPTPSPIAENDGFHPLDTDGRVYWEPGSEAVAARVAAELPSAIARVEGAQGRPFPRPVQVYVAGDLRSFARFSPTLRAAAVMDGTRIIISPRIAEQPERLRGLLVHELSHLHLVYHLDAEAAIRLPVWFREGLAVFVSNGAGAERVTEEEAVIALMDAPCVLYGGEDQLALPGDAVEQGGSPHVFYRQAGMFVEFLSRRGTGAFERLLDEVLEGGEFGEVFVESYGGTPADLFHEFVGGVAEAIGSVVQPHG